MEDGTYKSSAVGIAQGALDPCPLLWIVQGRAVPGPLARLNDDDPLRTIIVRTIVYRFDPAFVLLFPSHVRPLQGKDATLLNVRKGSLPAGPLWVEGGRSLH